MQRGRVAPLGIGEGLHGVLGQVLDGGVGELLFLHGWVGRVVAYMCECALEVCVGVLKAAEVGG